jgi:hypothetical protein
MHRFPGPKMLTEGHLFVPFPVPCYPKAYLTMWAILGRRSPDQRALAWGQTLPSNLEFNVEFMGEQMGCEVQMSKRRVALRSCFLAEGSERRRRSREPYRRKKIVLERVENVVKGKTPDSISCE